MSGLEAADPISFRQLSGTASFSKKQFEEWKRRYRTFVDRGALSENRMMGASVHQHPEKRLPYDNFMIALNVLDMQLQERASVRAITLGTREECARYLLELPLNEIPILTEPAAMWEGPPVESRPYQQHAVDWRLRHAGENCLIEMPTATGKTLIIAQDSVRWLAKWLLAHAGAKVLVGTPTGRLSKQHRDRFSSGKYGQDIRTHLHEGRVVVDTSHSLLSRLETYIPDDTVPAYLVIDEGHKGFMRAEAAEKGKEPGFPSFGLAKKLRVQDPDWPHRQTSVFSATPDPKCREDGQGLHVLVPVAEEVYRVWFGVTSVLSARDDPQFRRLMHPYIRRKDVHPLYCQPTPEYGYVCELLGKRAWALADRLRKVQVDADESIVGFPYFRSDQREMLEPPAPHRDAMNVLEEKLQIMREALDGDPSVEDFRGNAYRSLLGLWRRSVHDPKRGKEEIGSILGLLKGYLSRQMDYEKVRTSTYTGIYQKLLRASDCLAIQKARELHARGEDRKLETVREADTLTKAHGIFRRSELAPLLDQLRRCVRRANDYQKTGQEGRAQSAYLDLHDCLEVLSERTPEVDPSAAHYYLLQDRHLRDVVQSIELAPLHPKMQMLLSHIEIHGRDSGNGIFIRIAETTDLYDYVSVLRSRGFHVAFVIGGENASNDIELNNRLACQGFAAGRHNIILTTDVCNNGIELPAANMLFLKDVPGNAGDVIQWFGRVGREAGMRTDVFPMFLDVPGSHDQRRKHLSWVQRDREQASTERSASTHTSEESAVYLSVGPLFDTRSASE